MSKDKSDRETLIEQCLQDAYCERTGEILDESLKSWFAGKKAQVGQAAKNVKTGIGNAVKTVGNAGVVAGRGIKTGLSNAKKGIAHNAAKGARKLAAKGLERLGASNAAQEIRDTQAQADQNFQYDQVDTTDAFAKGKYGSVTDARTNAERVTLAKQIVELLTQFQAVGGKIPKIGINTLIQNLKSVK